MAKKDKSQEARELLEKIVHEDSRIFGIQVRTTPSGNNWVYKHIRLFITDAKNDMVDITKLVAQFIGYKLDSDDNLKSSDYPAQVASYFFQRLYNKEPSFRAL